MYLKDAESIIAKIYQLETKLEFGIPFDDGDKNNWRQILNFWRNTSLVGCYEMVTWRTTARSGPPDEEVSKLLEKLFKLLFNYSHDPALEKHQQNSRENCHESSRTE